MCTDDEPRGNKQNTKVIPVCLSFRMTLGLLWCHGVTLVVFVPLVISL